jgi:hypothetical protein
MVNVRNGHYELINFYNVSWDIDQNMLSQTKHINQPTTMSIKQRYQKQSLSLYGIDDNMHPQKQKIEVSHENMIKKPKHFHWKPMHNEKLLNLMIIPSSILKDIAKKFLINNCTLKLRFIQVYSHLWHLHKKILILKKILTLV